jgi:hypothetical protein
MTLKTMPALQGGALLHTGHGVIPVLRRLIVVN